MVSTLNGPIPPHPYYNNTDQSQYLNRPVPRVRPEAKEIAANSQGTVGMLLQVQGHSTFAVRKSRAEPKDHVQENVRRMRQIQRAAKHKETEKQTPVKALWKSSKYESVSSKVKDELQKEPPAPRPTSANFLRAHSRTGYIPMSARPASAEPPEEKLTVPKAQTAREVSLYRRNIDFIKLNGKAVKYAGMRRAPSLTALDDLKKKQEEELAHYPKGQVPKYLQQRKKQWEEEEQQRLASMPDPDLPEGHKLMPDAERRETLEKLKATEKELLAQLNSMPIRTDTHRIRTRKEELERKLTEVDEAIKIFSRRKVFVKMDE